MSDLMTFPDTVEEFMEQYKIIDTEQVYTNGAELVPIFRMEQWFEHLPTTEPTLRERALMLLLKWAVECDFGYDNFPEEYERYKDEIVNMNYFDSMIYIAEKEVKRNG